MASVFEDEFTDLQAGLISLCLEYANLAKLQVDRVYVHCHLTSYSASFDTFFEKDRQIIAKEKMNVPWKTRSSLMNIGVKDAMKIVDLCRAHSRPIPADIKMVYDARTNGFKADYDYENKTFCKKVRGEYIVKNSGMLFDEWMEEVRQSLLTQ